MYGRYPHEGSLAFRQGFLKRPIADEWMEQLKELLKQRFPHLQFASRRFTYLPTYDVDMAWCYREKGLLRNGAGLLRQLVTGQWADAVLRLQVLAGRRPDPFDVFNDLDKLHTTYQLKPQYFFLLAPKNKGYDRNILPHKPRFRALVHRLANRYAAGIHFSWQAHTDSSFEAEQAQLAQIAEKPVNTNRFHYIRMWLPVSYRQLLALSTPITVDHSMGYGSINGFRASTCTPFFWYDLEAEAATGLLIYPFAYMEANSIFEQKHNPEQALDEWQALYSKVHAVGGTFVTIVHNHMIGTDAEGRRWWQVYQSFLQRNFG
jgi:hypothetical protein